MARSTGGSGVPRRDRGRRPRRRTNETEPTMVPSIAREGGEGRPAGASPSRRFSSSATSAASRPRSRQGARMVPEAIRTRIMRPQSGGRSACRCATAARGSRLSSGRLRPLPRSALARRSAAPDIIAVVRCAPCRDPRTSRKSFHQNRSARPTRPHNMIQGDVSQAVQQGAQPRREW